MVSSYRLGSRIEQKKGTWGGSQHSRICSPDAEWQWPHTPATVTSSVMMGWISSDRESEKKQKQKKPLPSSVTRKRVTSTEWVAYPVEISYILVLPGKPRPRCFSWRLAHGLVDHLTVVSSEGVICFAHQPAQKPTSSGNPRRHILCETISLGILEPCQVKITTPGFNIGIVGRAQVSPEQNPLWKETLKTNIQQQWQHAIKLTGI